MPRRVFKKIRKRSGRLHKFDVAKIENAIGSAGRVTGEIDNKIAKEANNKGSKTSISDGRGRRNSQRRRPSGYSRGGTTEFNIPQDC